MQAQNKVKVGSKGRSSFFARFKYPKVPVKQSSVEMRQPKQPVVEVTTANFNQIVFDPNQDVLIEFYTDSTKEEVKETYERVGNYFVHSEWLTVAKCNVDKNFVPVELYHIPTIKIYPINQKGSPREYFDKATDFDRYVQFLKEEGSRSFRMEMLREPKNGSVRIN